MTKKKIVDAFDPTLPVEETMALPGAYAESGYQYERRGEWWTLVNTRPAQTLTTGQTAPLPDLVAMQAQLNRIEEMLQKTLEGDAFRRGYMAALEGTMLRRVNVE